MKPIAFPFSISKTPPSCIPQRQGHTRKVLAGLEKDVLELTENQIDLASEVQEGNTEKLQIILAHLKQYCADLFNLRQLGKRYASTLEKIKTSVDDDKEHSFKELLEQNLNPKQLEEIFNYYNSLLIRIESFIN
jgi:hypothetical protein